MVSGVVFGRDPKKDASNSEIHLWRQQQSEGVGICKSYCEEHTVDSPAGGMTQINRNRLKSWSKEGRHEEICDDCLSEVKDRYERLFGSN